MKDLWAEFCLESKEQNNENYIIWLEIQLRKLREEMREI